MSHISYLLAIWHFDQLELLFTSLQLYYSFHDVTILPQEDLRESDQVIYREFEKIRLAIEEIKETRQQEEKKMAEENLFDEYFGTLFGTRKATTKVKVQGRSASLQLPILNNGRKPSQTLV